MGPSLIKELGLFLKNNKKWWILPMIIVFLILGAMVFISGTPVAPFIYTIF